MSSQVCHKARPRLADWLLKHGSLEGAPEGLRTHLDTCRSCRREISVLEAGVKSLASVEPPAADDALIRRQISAALRPHTLPIEETRPFWLWRPALVVAFAGLVVALGVGLYLRSGTPVPSAALALPTLVEGELHAGDVTMKPGAAIRLDQQLEASLDEDAKIKLPDGSAFRATGGTRFAVNMTAGVRIRLTAGRVDVSAKKQRPEAPLRVETQEGEACVVGTRFSVVRREHERGGVTVVAVAEGIVRVTGKLDKSVRMLARGESVTLGLQPESAPAVAVAARPTPATTPAAPPRIPDIRTRIKQGRVHESRALIEQARLEMPRRPRDLAELAMAEAEAELAEGRQASAIERYLDVVARYPETPQAEQALFAAAQLSMGRTPREATRLLERYIALYPRGRFIEDARRLLRSIEQRQKQPGSSPAPPATR